jgi:hypothetical protein
MKNLRKTLYAALMTAFIGIMLNGCTSIQLQQKPPKSMKIAVVSFMGNEANVFNRGTMGSNTGKIKLAPFPFDAKLTRRISNTLRSRGYTNVNIIKAPRNNPITQATPWAQVVAFTQVVYKTSYVKNIIAPSKYDMIVVVMPAVNNDVGISPLVFRYGIFINKGFGTADVYFYAGYRVQVLDGNNYRPLAQKVGQSSKDVTNLNWSKQINFCGEINTIPQPNIRKLKNWLMTKVISGINTTTINVLNI